MKLVIFRKQGSKGKHNSKKHFFDPVQVQSTVLLQCRHSAGTLHVKLSTANRLFTRRCLCIPRWLDLLKVQYNHSAGTTHPVSTHGQLPCYPGAQDPTAHHTHHHHDEVSLQHYSSSNLHSSQGTTAHHQALLFSLQPLFIHNQSLLPRNCQPTKQPRKCQPIKTVQELPAHYSSPTKLAVASWHQ